MERTRRRIALEIRVIETTYRYEHRRLESEAMRAFRIRARALLDDLEADATETGLLSALNTARQMFDRDERLVAGGLGKEAVDGVGQLVDPERLS